MTVAVALSFLVATATGTLLLRLVWPRTEPSCPWPLAVALGAGLGAGLSSVLLFLSLLLAGPSRWYPLAEAGLLALVATAAAARQRPAPVPSAPTTDAGGRSRWRLLLIAAFMVGLAAAAGAFLSSLRQHPHGEWDAWMNWTMRARMIFRGGDGWRAAYANTFPWSHPDYPPLVPSLVVRGWLYAGRETLLSPSLVAATFTFGSAALLATALAALRSTGQGLLAGLVLLSTPFYLLHGTSLYGDVPLSFFFLAAIVCLALDGRQGGGTARFAALAGAAAGLSMWTKNEGWLFTVAVGAGLMLAGAPGTGALGTGAVRRRRVLAFGAGLLLPLLMVAGFKIAFAPPNDLLSTLGVERTVGRLTAPDRYYITLREYLRHIAQFGANGFGSAGWVLAAYLLGLGLHRREAGRPWVTAVGTALGLLLAGHFVVYVSMADELARLLASSLDRLLVQLWPSVLFLFFMVARTPEEADSGRPAVAPSARAGARSRSP